MLTIALLLPHPAPVGNKSGRTVQVREVQKELPGLDAPPWPGELGQRIFENVSAQAWKLWEERQKMILNEYRLMPWQKEAQELIAQADGGFLLRRRRRAAARVRAAADEVAVGSAGTDHGHFPARSTKPQAGRAPRAAPARRARGIGAAREDESQIAAPLRQRHEQRVRLRRDPHLVDAGDRPRLLHTVDTAR